MTMGTRETIFTLFFPAGGQPSGRLFYYILYYLQVGDIPCRCGTGSSENEYMSLLSRNEIQLLKTEADFYGLEGLAELCEKPLQVLMALGSVGDFDASLYSEIHVDIKNEHYTCGSDYRSYVLTYTYKQSAVVRAAYYKG